jgi:hypothetical protein
VLCSVCLSVSLSFRRHRSPAVRHRTGNIFFSMSRVNEVNERSELALDIALKKNVIIDARTAVVVACKPERNLLRNWLRKLFFDSLGIENRGGTTTPPL